MTKDTLSAVKQITFEEILPIWHNQLWPNRVSKIETHSAMTWPMTNINQPYDIKAFGYPAYFFGIFHNEKLIAVNSGHLTSSTEFRSRGLWVDPDYRKQGLAQLLLKAAVDTAIQSKADIVWSIPKLAVIDTYTKVGFKPVYSIPVMNVEFGPNVYAVLDINTMYAKISSSR